MMKKYKAVFSDIDGTLLNSKHQIPESTKEKIKQIKSPADCDRKMSWSARKLFTDPETIW